ncbi:hypothetical protein GCM10010988_08020 [Cnuibacter physcomitrellae]|nr:hypothetical protein GCM10010988_08020 [Cnuibacter physcomitrellae]
MAKTKKPTASATTTAIAIASVTLVLRAGFSACWEVTFASVLAIGSGLALDASRSYDGAGCAPPSGLVPPILLTAV